MEGHRQKFEQFAQRYTATGKRPTSGTITRELGKKISQYLKSEEPDSNKGAEARRFRLFIKKFKLINCKELGMVDILIVPSKQAKNNTGNQLIPEGYLRVAYVDEFFDIIHSVHCNELNHAGVKKTYKKVASSFWGIPRSAIEEYINLCETCHLKKPQKTVPPIKAIISNGFMKRLQVDLIDMSHMPDGDYKYILHSIDHWSRFNFLAALEKKESAPIAVELEKIFSLFGPPKIFHSDNGSEFVSKSIDHIIEAWPGEIQVVRGRPRHPQSQGMIEQALINVEHSISVMMAECPSDTKPWSSWLPQICYAINTQQLSATGCTPYELVFGRPPSTTIIPTVLKQSAVITDSNLDDDEDVDFFSMSVEEQMNYKCHAEQPRDGL
ncbi:KRAB-A domain-containing protein 2-like [Hydractinia symbiolongicarpus]|uniref:KRAB-A domain-containing protein 2-like n=1 Tax=Hydractinia symbiolongicarpus TaxID=13093 RepID=UPI00254ACDD7|nr:KRAB-A domain-containing protein 2-like [Hydractinia symbiolongicarpus]